MEGLGEVGTSGEKEGIWDILAKIRAIKGAGYLFIEARGMYGRKGKKGYEEMTGGCSTRTSERIHGEDGGFDGAWIRQQKKRRPAVRRWSLGETGGIARQAKGLGYRTPNESRGFNRREILSRRKEHH